MNTRVIHGRCHCGNIHYELTWPADALPITLRECSCDFCQMHGGNYTSHPDSKLAIQVEDGDKLIRYRFGHKTADFMLCANCGILMFAICPIDGKEYAVINANNFENLATDDLIQSVTNFDLESLDIRLARRKKNWTPDVSFSGLN